MTGISKLNGRSSKLRNLILNVLYCSLWNLVLGILLFLLAEAFFNIPRTLEGVPRVSGYPQKLHNLILLYINQTQKISQKKKIYNIYG